MKFDNHFMFELINLNTELKLPPSAPVMKKIAF